MAGGQPYSLPATLVLGLALLCAPYGTHPPGDGQCQRCPRGKPCTSRGDGAGTSRHPAPQWSLWPVIKQPGKGWDAVKKKHRS